MRFNPPTLAFVMVLSSILGVAGCGSGNVTSPIGPTNAAPTITTQPSSQTIPVSLTARFSVLAGEGSGITYQWFRNGTAITGANASSYTTSAVAASDSGTVFTVTLSDSAGSITSQPATLTAGGRAPKSGDLRFQQVDAESTINGYTEGQNNITMYGQSSYLYGDDTGTPLIFSSGQCPTPYNPAVAPCNWQFVVDVQPSGVTPLATGYVSDASARLQQDLNNGLFASSMLGGGPINASNTVVTSLSVVPSSFVFALSYIKTSAIGGFDLRQSTIAPSALQNAATQEGVASRVITALSFVNGQLLYFSYGWTGDTTTVYETKVATATYATAPAAAQALSGQGYILTAFGGDDADGLVIVGTRVQGDVLPRAISLATGSQLQPLQQQGFAPVAVVQTTAGDISTRTAIGQR